MNKVSYVAIPFILLHLLGCSSLEKTSKSINIEKYNFKTIKNSIRIFPTTGGKISDRHEYDYNTGLQTEGQGQNLIVGNRPFFNIFYQSLIQNKIFSSVKLLNEESELVLITAITKQSSLAPVIKLDHKVELKVRYILMKAERVLLNKEISSIGKSNFKDNFLGSNRHIDAFVNAISRNIYLFYEELKKVKL